MYKKILVALENGPADQSLIPHVSKLASLLHSELLLVHVADGWVARNFDELKLAESDEMKADRAYLQTTAAALRSAGLAVDTHLGLGDPASEIVKTAVREGCDLIALAAHGHRAIGDFFFGSTISHVHHAAHIPILVVRAEEAK
jgi:nucleotide-binding universal stress UspA family protein